MVKHFLTVLLVVCEILTDVSLNSLLMNFVTLPIYVNLAQVVLLLFFGFVFAMGLLNCFIIKVSYPLFLSMCLVVLSSVIFIVVIQVVGVHSVQLVSDGCVFMF